ncbi:MAG TPA: hypothetical protein PLP29_03320 [Candidatus Ozemobacteraceae bacterium]|nr:hypothetical protein [Candidatus Ozemobacteraceae bacterium]
MTTTLSRTTLAVLLLAGLLLLFSQTPLPACNPEPGPQHFPPPAAPDPVFRTGYFELHSSLSGLPCNRIRSVLALEEAVLAGTEGGGLMILRDGLWRAWLPDSKPPFPSRTVTSLSRGEDGIVLAATPDGLVAVSGLSSELRFERITLPTPDGTNILSSIQSGRTIWAGTDGTAGAVTGSRLVPCRIDGDRQPTGFGAVARHDGGVWFGSSLGLYEAREGLLVAPLLGGFDQGWVQGLAPVGEWLVAAGSKGLFAKKGDTAVELIPGVWTTCVAAPSDGDRALTAALGPQEELPGERNELDSLTEQTRETTALLSQMNTEYQRVSRLYAMGSAPTWDDMITYMENLNRLQGQVVLNTNPLQRGIWVGTQDQGAILLGMDGKRSRLTADNSKLPENRITCVSTREDGEAWIGTFESGLLHYTKYTSSQKPVPVPVWKGEALAIAPVGENLYVGTKNQGLLAFDIKSLQQTGAWSPNQPSGFHRRVNAVALDSRLRLWTGGDAGVWMLDEAGWHRFTRNEGVPAEEIAGIETDADGRVYIAGAGDGPLSERLAIFTESGFTGYDAAFLKSALNRKGATATDTLKALQMGGAYQRSFDAANASQALSLYDVNPVEAAVSAMLGTPHYLMMGLENGHLYLFDGEAFKPVSTQGTGDLRRVPGLARRPGGDLVILGKSSCLMFDGQTFKPALPLPEALDEYTSLALDQKNPELFWVSFSSGTGGGWALYQHPAWKVFSHPQPVRQLAISDPFGFILTPEGVFRINL